MSKDTDTILAFLRTVGMQDDFLIDTDPNRIVRGTIRFVDVLHHAALFGWAEGDDNDAHGWRVTPIAEVWHDLTVPEAECLLYVVANAAADGTWHNIAQKVAA